MSYGAGGGDQPIPPGGMLASEGDRERTQGVLKQAFEDQRLTQDEFESRVGSALSARTLGELAQLTRDLPVPVPAAVPARRPRRTWLIAGIGAVVLAGIVIALVSALSSGPAAPSRTAAAKPASNPGDNSGITSSGPAKCPVGTSATALAIANSLAGDPVYADPGSSLLTAAQAGRLRAEISQADPGRIRLAAVTDATAGQGGERALANAISSCPADAAGVTVVTTANSTYLVTSYANYRGTSQAVGAALNTHASLAAGLRDAVKRMALLDPQSG